ncbi:MAG TPA: endonuclease/exonuclease/phosphatase family protein [Vicinamibacterales bacterium]|jgi:endonuclease/exonuclease/phosphatase family metal-dependent hydrolase|nr:endonuclease/exonuclease/phosphatase family protein [Vicinamibacterales bacterium]
MGRRNLVCAATLAALCAASAAPVRGADQVRVLVLNMHAGKDAAGKPNLDAVVSLVKEKKPDLVLLQEVDRNTNRSGHVDQVAELARQTKYDSAFSASLFEYDGGQYGVAVLSREIIGYHVTVPLPVVPVQTRAGGSREPRVALLTVAEVRDTTWRAMNAHLDPADDGGRPQEMAALTEAIRSQEAAGTPLIVGGDLNSTPDDPVLQPLRGAGLRDAWTECGSGDGFTFPADQPTKRIDYLWLQEGLKCTSAEVLDSRISDHRPLLVTLK